jgi:hypothetical protein
VSSLFDSLYVEAIEAVKLQAALSVSSTALIRILGEIKLEARFQNFSQSRWLSTGAEISLAII